MPARTNPPSAVTAPAREALPKMKPSRTIVAVLGYHKIGQPPRGGWETWFYVPERIFREQLACLSERGWRVIDMPTLLRGLQEPEALPERAAVLTFDDGYRSMRRDALPCLKQFGFPATLFVPTDYVGKTNSFDTDTEPEERICNWNDLRALERAGVSIQSHGASHRAFSTLRPESQMAELAKSKAVLERTLKKRVAVFAFPYGDTGPRPRPVTKRLKQAGYQAAFLYGGGACRWPAVDPYRLPRLAMGPDTNLPALLKPWEKESRSKRS
jgi:peptidoglycan/xylan/chitin deacetylase (PgdA/CDA1 family)